MLKRMLIVACLLLPLLAACGSKEEKRDDFYKQAVEDYEAGRYTEAMLNVRNALKIDQKYAPARSLLGDLMIQEKEWRRAFLAYTAATEEDPNLAHAHIGLAKLYVLTGSLDKAEESVATALQLEPDNPDAKVLRATLLARQGDFAGTKRLLEEILAQDPSMSEAYLLKSEIVAQEQGFDAAYAVLEEGAKLVGRRKSTLLIKAGLFAINQKDFDKAAGYYGQLADEFPEEASYRMMQANALFQGGKAGEAAVLLQRLIDTEPENQDYRIALAKMHMANKDQDASITVMESAIKDIPQSYKVAAELAKVHLAAGNQDKAKEFLREQLAGEDEHADKVLLQRLLIQLLASQGEFEESKAQVEALLARNPRDVDGLMMRGQLLLREEENLKAISDFRQVLGEQPDMHNARVLLARAHFQNKEPFTAVEELEKILAANPDFNPARELLMRHYMSERKFNKLREQLQTLAERNPKSPLQPILIGDTYMQEQDWDNAQEAYMAALEKFPAQPGIRTKMAGLALARPGDDQDKIKEARTWLNEELTVQGDFLPAIQTLVRLDLMEGKPKDALNFVRKVSKEHPDNYALLGLKGSLESRNKNFGAAREDLNKVIENRPDQAGAAYLELARTYTLAGEPDKAIERFEKAAAENPSDFRASFLVGILHEQGGNRDAAAKAYRQALKANANFIPAANNLAYMLVQNATGTEDLEEALALAEMAAKGESPDALDTLGTVQLSLGRVEQALDSFMRAYAKAPENPAVLYHLARTHAMRGEPQKAMDYLQRALDKGEFPEREQAEELKATLQK